jgi:hypothetical protein
VSLAVLLLVGAAGLSPGIAPDTDGDGISDADEDTNHNGIVDPGESDPKKHDSDGDNVPDDVERHLGTDPLDARDVPNIPEPLFIDLIRNLGSHRGELEVNVLSATTFRKTPAVRWGPEIEYTPIAGFGLELEVPLLDQHVEAIKPGAQVTLGSTAGRRLEFGALATHSQFTQELGSYTTLAAITGVRFTQRITGITIVGPTLTTERGHAPRLGGMLSPTVFYQVNREVILALELGYAARADERAQQIVLPQVHLELGHVDVQVGLGGAHEGDGKVRVFTAVRICWER